MQHKSCNKCIDERKITQLKEEGKYKEEKQIIIGSRHMPSYIMYDGEGKYNRKLNQEHQNWKVQIGFNWQQTQNETPQEKYAKIPTSISSVEQLPKIYGHKKLLDVVPMKPSVISTAHLNRFGKYSQRYLQKTDLFGSNSTDFTPSSEKYGKFYLSEERVPPIKMDVAEWKSFDNESQGYKVFPREQPVLTYHSLKSQLFKQK